MDILSAFSKSYIKSWPYSSCYLNLTSSLYMLSQHKWSDYEFVCMQHISVSAACLKSLKHVNVCLCDFSNLKDSNCCLFMIMQYSCPSKEAGQTLSAPIMKTQAPPTPWNKTCNMTQWNIHDGIFPMRFKWWWEKDKNVIKTPV